MRDGLGCLTGMMVLCLSVSLLAAANPASRPSKADLSSPKAAATSFVEALVEGDVAAAQAAVIASPKQQQSVELLATMAGSMARLTDAAVAKFGQAGEDISGQSMRLEENFKQIEHAAVQVDGDTATLTSENQSKPVTLKKENGQWKVDMSSMPGTEQLLQSSAAIKAMAKAATDTASDITAGKYATAPEARQAFQKQMMAALLANMPTSRPAEAPATQP